MTSLNGRAAHKIRPTKCSTKCCTLCLWVVINKCCRCHCLETLSGGPVTCHSMPSHSIPSGKAQPQTLAGVGHPLPSPTGWVSQPPHSKTAKALWACDKFNKLQTKSANLLNSKKKTPNDYTEENNI